jgi:hypothetical protein
VQAGPRQRLRDQQIVQKYVDDLLEDKDRDRSRDIYVLAGRVWALTRTLCGIGDDSEDLGIPEPSMMAQQLLRIGAINFYEIAENLLDDR